MSTTSWILIAVGAYLLLSSGALGSILGGHGGTATTGADKRIVALTQAGFITPQQAVAAQTALSQHMTTDPAALISGVNGLISAHPTSAGAAISLAMALGVSQGQAVSAWGTTAVQQAVATWG